MDTTLKLAQNLLMERLQQTIEEIQELQKHTGADATKDLEKALRKMMEAVEGITDNSE